MTGQSLKNEQGELDIALGDEVEATVLSTEGELRLSKKLLKGAHAQQRLALAVEQTLPVEGRVARETKGGYEVTVAGLRAFCPFSQMSCTAPMRRKSCSTRPLSSM